MKDDDLKPNKAALKNKNRFGGVLEACESLLNQLKQEAPESWFSIITFNHEASIVIPPKQVSSSDILADIVSLNSLKPDGDTNFDKVLITVT